MAFGTFVKKEHFKFGDWILSKSRNTARNDLRKLNQLYFQFFKLLWQCGWVLLLASCGRVTLEIEGLPENTPPGASVFVGGNFNFWEPGDANFRFQKSVNGKYCVNFPIGWGDVEYKFSRGDWTSVEGDGCGHKIENRTFSIGTSLFSLFGADTLRHKIYSWEDLGPTHCQQVTLRIRKLPKETPNGDPIHLVGNFNDWIPGDAKYKFYQNAKDKAWYLTLTKADRDLEFKVTRGSWDYEEVDDNGDRLPNRKFSFGKFDTLDIEVEGWIDINPGLEKREVSFLVHTPIGTPPADPVYLVGNFNKWKPADPAFELKKIAPNLFFIRFEKPKGIMEYKFTRGPWGMEEVDVFGNHISNRILRTSADTVKISVPEWLDIPVEQTFTLNREEMNFIMNNPNVIAFPLTENEKPVKFVLKPEIKVPTFFYIRVGLPSSPNNRNYGICDLVKPGSEFQIVAPEGSNFYACDGPYWNDFKPKEIKVFTVTKSMEGKVIDAGILLPPK